MSRQHICGISSSGYVSICAACREALLLCYADGTDKTVSVTSIVYSVNFLNIGRGTAGNLPEGLAKCAGKVSCGLLRKIRIDGCPNFPLQRERNRVFNSG